MYIKVAMIKYQRKPKTDRLLKSSCRRHSGSPEIFTMKKKEAKNDCERIGLHQNQRLNFSPNNLGP